MRTALMRAIIALASFPTLFGCEREPDISPPTSQPERMLDKELREPGFDFGRARPQELLKVLETRTMEITVADRIPQWVKEEEVDELLALLDSRRPCMPVVSKWASTIPKTSTVGDEAALMIESFRRGYYPPELSASVLIMRNPSIKSELRQWWKEQRD